MGVHNTTPPNYIEMTRPNNYYSPLLQTNYEKTTAKIIPNSKINTSQSEKILI